jgi:glycosyltransferase involved in cell wall biosynthesis
MHVVFVHRQFPAQFGHVANYLTQRHGVGCTFVSEEKPNLSGGGRRIQFRMRGGAGKRTHYCSESFENYTWRSHAVYEALQAHPEVKPDLIVGHSGFGSTLFLGDLYDCPIINYCEWYYAPAGGEIDFRPEFRGPRINALRARGRNAALLADLQNCARAYSPTQWQRSRLPAEYQGKLETIFDGIDTDFWRRLDEDQSPPRTVAGREIPAGTRIVTYVSRGFESMRGFDIFVRVAKRICQTRSDVVFVCVGSDRCCYGNDAQFTGGKTFREYVLEQECVDLDRFIFTGMVPPAELVRIFNLSDLHIYLTVPFILSWSMMNALACGCTVLGSDTEPVREMIEDGVNGLLAPFNDVDGLAAKALAVLDDPAGYRRLGEAGMRMIHEKYSLPVVIPKMLDLYDRVLAGASGRAAPSVAAIASPATLASAIRPAEELDQLYAQGNELSLKEQLTEAARCYEQVLAHRPRHEWANNNLGYCLVRLGLSDRGIWHLQQALAANPDNAKALANLTLAYGEGDRRFESLPYRRRLVELNPTEAQYPSYN